MRDLYSTRQSLESRLQSEGFKFRVNQIISAWDDWAVYPKDFLTKLNKSFNGIEVKVCVELERPLLANSGHTRHECSFC